MELENNKEQTGENSDVNENQPNNNTYTVNGKDVTPEQLIESYNNLQSEFTKKSQKLSEYEKKGEQIDDIAKKSEDIEKANKIREEEEVFNTFKSNFTNLSEYQFKTIRDLQSVDQGKSFEDIAESYGILNDAKIKIAKSNRSIVGNNIGLKSNEKETISISSNARKQHNIKSTEVLEEIKSSFGI